MTHVVAISEVKYDDEPDTVTARVTVDGILAATVIVGFTLYSTVSVSVITEDCDAILKIPVSNMGVLGARVIVALDDACTADDDISMCPEIEEPIVMKFAA